MITHLRSKLRLYFISGLLAIIPIGLTIFIIQWIIKLGEQLFRILPSVINPIHYLSILLKVSPNTLYPLSLLFILLFILLVGMLTAGYIGRSVLNLTTKIINRLPLIRTVYLSSQQILETIFKKDARSFKEVVFVEFPKKDSWVIGLITNKNPPTVHELKKKYPDDTILSIFLPTTPNPTSGYLLFVLEKNIIHTTMKTETAFKIIVSGGVLTPELKKKFANTPNQSVST